MTSLCLGDCPVCGSKWVNGRNQSETSPGCGRYSVRDRRGKLRRVTHRTTVRVSVVCRSCGFSGPAMPDYVGAAGMWNKLSVSWPNTTA